MTVPPLIVDLRFTRPGGAQRHLWIPVFVLWPLLLVVGLLAMALAVIADGVLYAVDRGGVGWTGVVIGLFGALAEARGLNVTVHGPTTDLDIVVR